ncbi:hypothetical protein [Streptomyces sp. CAU 1734]|uniref:phage distal tail protein n=1 Tax=Streptomyces sp. CAU 1734 TaxID=3140360 RepID=UPI003260F5E3
MYLPGQDLGGLRVDLGTIPLGGVDDQGVAWPLQEMDGWDSPEVRAEVHQRAADHGAWLGPRYLAERPVTLAGKIIAPGAAELDAAMERLRAAIPLDTTVLTVRETVPKQATVTRSGKVLLRHLTDSVAEFSVMVTAGDPRRYGVDEEVESTTLPSATGGLVFPATFPVAFSATVVAGEIRAVNAGTFETRPAFTVDGPVSAPQIIGLYADGTTRQLAYGQDLAAGDQLVIDTDAPTVTLNGTASRRRFLAVPSGWPTIPANSTVTYQFRAAAPAPAALLTARWRSAWI